MLNAARKTLLLVRRGSAAVITRNQLDSLDVRGYTERPA
jgi:hypothetical protein